MSNEIQKTEQRSLIATMANRFGLEPNKLLAALKATAFKGATDEEMVALCIVANQYGLNPFTREIFAFPAKGGGIQPVVSVDGWIRLMNEHHQFDGIEFEEVVDHKSGKPIATTANIYRKDRTRPTKVTEWFSECYRKTDAWDTRPRRMLRHKATIQAARTAFGFAGIIDEDEIVPVNPILPTTSPKLAVVEVESTVTSEILEADKQPGIVSVIKELRDKMANPKKGDPVVTEGVMIQFISEVCPIGGASTLEQVAEVSDETLRTINNQWEDIILRIKEAK